MDDKKTGAYYQPSLGQPLQQPGAYNATPGQGPAGPTTSGSGALPPYQDTSYGYGAGSGPGQQVPSYGPDQDVPSYGPGQQPISDYGSAHDQYAAQPAGLRGADVNNVDPNAPPRKSTGWAGKLGHFGIKAVDPINALANKMGSNSFMPMTMEKECKKAMDILRSFCESGVLTADVDGPALATTTATGKVSQDAPGRPSSSRKALIKIPPKVLANARGLAIFTTFRLGFHLSGAVGSGIVLARLPDGQWGPPSGINVHSVGGGILIGVDIYDCVCVINSPEALAAFTSNRLSLGSDFAVVAGPYGAGAGLDIGKGTAPDRADMMQTPGPQAPNTPYGDGVNPAPAGPLKQNPVPGSTASHKIKPVYSYVKSRGLYAGIAIDGTAIVERKDANAAFYGVPTTADAILRGQLPPAASVASASWRASVTPLHDLLRASEVVGPGYGTGYGGANANSYPSGPAPANGYGTGPGADTADELPPYQEEAPLGVGDKKTTPYKN